MQMAQQLKMIRKSSPVRELPLPDGYSYEYYTGDEAQVSDWLRICKEGLIEPSAGNECFRSVIVNYPDLDPENDLIFVLAPGGERVATIAFVLHPGGVGYLHMVCCLEAFRGIGIGAAMTSFALAQLEMRGIRYTYLTTDEFRLAAIRSYLSAGFEPCEDSDEMRSRWEEVRRKITESKRSEGSEISEGEKTMDYSGKYFSVVGDSISTLSGFIPDGYALYYDENNMKNAGIESADDTWWGQIIFRLGGKLLKNNSWSGSTVSYHAEFTPGSFAFLDSRMSLLGGDGIDPDVIMIYMGVNDWASGTPIESYGNMPENMSFTGAYRIMLDLIKEHYPNAEVWCISPAISTLRGDPNFEFPYCLGGRHIREYADAIGKVAAEKGCIFVDANKNEKIVDALDGIHPDKNGMYTLADEIIKKLPVE